MNSQTSWNVESIDPAVRERAEAAARRSGMSLNQWLDTNAVANDSEQLPSLAYQRDVAEVHQKIDALSRQLEYLSQLASREQTSEPREAHHAEKPAPVASARVFAEPTPQLSPAPNPDSLEFAIAEISARQNELAGHGSRQQAHRAANQLFPASPQFSAFENRLAQISSQLDDLRRSDTLEHSIALFRGELSEIRHVIHEAMPRQAIESIENEVRFLSQRIEETRRNCADTEALAGVETTLAEIGTSLRSLMPAEQLAGYEDAINNLGSKLDLILGSHDPSTVKQLEGAISALREIVSNVASNEALAQLSDNLHSLSSKLDQFTPIATNSNVFEQLDQRIASLTSALENQERSPRDGNPSHLEGALRALSDRIDRMPAADGGQASFVHVEQRISYLLERLETATDHRSSNFARVEEGLQEVLRHLELQRSMFAAQMEARSEGISPEDPLFDAVKRDLSDLRMSHTQTDRQTQDSLEVVHSTLSHVVDRLAAIETDLKTVKTSSPTTSEATTASQSAPSPAHSRPELPNPAVSHIVRDSATRSISGTLNAAAGPPLGQILDTHKAAVAAIVPVIVPELAPDTPIEPGTRRIDQSSSAAERIAASEEAIGVESSDAQPVNPSSFIAAARRAAQAAQTSSASSAKASNNTNPSDAGEPSTIKSKIRSLLVGASVVVIVLGTFKTAMTLLDTSPNAPAPSSVQDTAKPAAPANAAPSKPNVQAPASAPSYTSPMPIDRQSLNAPANNGAKDQQAATPEAPAPQVAAADVTGSIPATLSLAYPKVLSSPKDLPEAIGGPALRTLAQNGDAAAAYEVGVRFAEGKGVASNYDEAAKWYDRAAQAGLTPAIFRLGTLYEKGMGVKRDLEQARRYYAQAAERGNAKAMHNLAVLEADGGGKGANYKAAVEWFRKASERGVADSQFNLGILYARGIGVEQNLAESFKWFSLAAAQGDADAGQKRDDVAKRLDPQSLAAAKLAIQTFTPEVQPDAAVNVTAPAGGWDAANAPSTTKPAYAKRAMR